MLGDGGIWGLDLVVEEFEDFGFGVRVVEPDGSAVGWVVGVVGQFGCVEGVPTGEGGGERQRKESVLFCSLLCDPGFLLLVVVGVRTTPSFLALTAQGVMVCYQRRGCPWPWSFWRAARLWSGIAAWFFLGPDTPQQMVPGAEVLIQIWYRGRDIWN